MAFVKLIKTPWHPSIHMQGGSGVSPRKDKDDDLLLLDLGDPEPLAAAAPSAPAHNTNDLLSLGTCARAARVLLHASVCFASSHWLFRFCIVQLDIF
jgi:hypothetical protein